MDEIGVLHASDLAGGDDDLVRPVEIRIGLQAHGERHFLEDGRLLVGDPGHPDDVARIEAVGKRPVHPVERAEGYAGGGEKVGDRSADGAGRDFLTTVNERHG